MKMLQAEGSTFKQMKENFLSDHEGQKLYRQGDCILVWVNEADYCRELLNEIGDKN